MTRLTDLLATPGRGPVFVSDFSPPRGAAPALFEAAAALAGFDAVCVAYNPGKAVRPDSVAAAFEVRRRTGREVVFNLSPRDMNALALESRLLGAALLGLENVVVVQGDPITERDPMTGVADLTSTGLIAAIRQLNAGLDFRGAQLAAPTSLCVGGAIDLARGAEREARLTRRKVAAGADFFITQPVFAADEIAAFETAYADLEGAPLDRPVCWGLHIVAHGGVMFASVPAATRDAIAGGRDGVELALEVYAALRAAGQDAFYVVPPILRGGARDYAAAARFLSAARAAG